MQPTEKMRVAFISQGLGTIVPPKAHGSIATWTYETARRLSSTHSVMLIEFGERLFRTTRTEYEGLSCVYVPSAFNRLVNAVQSRVSAIWRRLWTAERRLRQPTYASIAHNLGFILQAAWIARRSRCDVIHIHNFSQFVPVVRLFNRSARIVIHMNCEWLSQHEPRMIERRLRSADVILGCSGHIVRRILAVFPHLQPKCRVVFNGADVDHFTPTLESVAANPPDPLRILFVGRISPEKGVHVLVDAFTAIASSFPSARLELVGGAGSLPASFLVALSDDPLVRGLEAFYQGDYLAEIKRRIPPALADRITFHGNVAQRDLAAHYGRASVFVNPSFSDAFPLTVVEAMAAGLPIVATAVGGVPESVAHDVTGVLVPPDNPEAMAAGLVRLLGDSKLRVAMGRAARKRADELFSWQAIAASVAHVYQASVSRSDQSLEASTPLQSGLANGEPTPGIRSH
jgi:glycosyltransferase involved in cell wall biosynthesis